MRIAREQLDGLAARLEGAAPAEILAEAAARFPTRIRLASSFGPEDNLLTDVIARGRLPIEIFTLDTGYLFPETYALWERLEQRYGIRFHARRAALPAADPGAAAPWQVDPDACCEARKVVPLKAELDALDAWVTGIRRDQTPERARARVFEWDARFGLVKVNPLVAWTSDAVWAYLEAHDVPTSPLHARGYLSIGCAPCTSPVRPGEDPRAGRWRGREKTECGLHLGPAARKPAGA